MRLNIREWGNWKTRLALNQDAMQVRSLPPEQCSASPTEEANGLNPFKSGFKSQVEHLASVAQFGRGRAFKPRGLWVRIPPEAPDLPTQHSRAIIVIAIGASTLRTSPALSLSVLPRLPVSSRRHTTRLSAPLRTLPPPFAPPLTTRPWPPRPDFRRAASHSFRSAPIRRLLPHHPISDY